MNTTGNTVLITGGATGIGLALAEAFANSGNQVLICGRRAQKLEEAKAKLPGLQTMVCDVSNEQDRLSLFVWASSKNVNILVNNAGIQRTIDLKNGVSALKALDEVDINLKAPIYLSAYFIPNLMKHKQSAIINISSGLGFVPISLFPVYCATKAAIHSFTISLRHQLRATTVKVFEIIPPTVITELNMEGRHGREVRGIEAPAVAAETIEALKADKFEHAVGFAEGLRNATGPKFDEVFNRMNP